MAKRLNCATCIYLNMHKKEFSENGHNYRYGCGIAESGYLPFWLCENRNDIELTTGGCMVTTKEEKQKFHRNMARARKENYLKQCQK